ncbi:unnamed protein product [Ceutorhynchus assimilis]|uniref:EF-hand domain-containing protein n=1 Tax=Ceutorhynchus assimilis TaxID=467358 RepID=A0A9P0GK98_9CUCU|nr:unnamed protein product [Ceutorhynchus assimilis]
MHHHNMTHHRPASPTSRQGNEMAATSLRDLQAGTHGSGFSDPAQRLRLLCLSRGAQGILGLGRVFRRMDKDGKKDLSLEEFSLGLKEMQLQISDEEIQEMFDNCDIDGTGTINIDEFLFQIRPPLSDARKNIIKEAFDKMDKAHEGEITIGALKRVYNVDSQPRYISGEDSREDILDKLLDNFDHDATRDGKVTKEEFFNYYAAISASIENDCYFNLMMRQAYKL